MKATEQARTLGQLFPFALAMAMGAILIICSGCTYPTDEVFDDIPGHVLPHSIDPWEKVVDPDTGKTRLDPVTGKPFYQHRYDGTVRAGHPHDGPARHPVEQPVNANFRPQPTTPTTPPPTYTPPPRNTNTDFPQMDAYGVPFGQ